MHRYHCELKKHLWRGPGRGWTRSMRIGRSGSSSQHLKISRHHQTEDMPSPPDWRHAVTTRLKICRHHQNGISTLRWASASSPSLPFHQLWKRNVTNTAHKGQRGLNLWDAKPASLSCQPHPHWKKLYQLLCLVFSPLCPGYCLVYPTHTQRKRTFLQSFSGFTHVLLLKTYAEMFGWERKKKKNKE